MSGQAASQPRPRISAADLADLQEKCDLLGLVERVTGKLRKTGKEYRGGCPLCHSKNSLTVYQKGGRWNWKCWAGTCEQGGPIDWLTKVLGLTFLDAVRMLGGDVDELHKVGVSPEVEARARQRQSEREAEARRDSERRRQAASDVWAGRVPVAGSPAESYLVGRGLAGPWPESIGYRADVRTVRATADGGQESVAFPALLGCVIGGDRRFLAVHRIFLSPGAKPGAPWGKAKGLQPSETKRALGDLVDGAVRLTRRPKVGGILALTEGIETGLAVAQALRRRGRLAETGGDCAVWSALFAGQLCRVGFGPDNFWRPSRVIVMADNDPRSGTGEAKAVEACQRFRRNFGIPAAWSMPDRPGWDWNDPLMKSTEAS